MVPSRSNATVPELIVTALEADCAVFADHTAVPLVAVLVYLWVIGFHPDGWL
jgi:hypothetical protein